jgi:hypothetical protein
MMIQEFQEIEAREFETLKSDPDRILNDLLGYFGRPSQDAKSYDEFIESLADNYVKYIDPEYDEWVRTYDSLDEAKNARRKSILADLNKRVGDRISKVYTKITYPLSRTAIFCFDLSFGGDDTDADADADADTDTDNGPLTAGHLLWIYTVAYQTVYALEEEEDGDPGHISGMLNRAKSNGPFGIWGHDITDLVYNGGSTVHIYEEYVICEFDCDS